jgi:DNA polymerase III subunit epsilon
MANIQGDLREIVLDTETTGLRTKDGHRILEIGCVELINKKRTGNTFHTYLNPKKRIDPNAYAVHGISDQFVSDKPVFSKIAQDFLDFIGASNLVIHNAVFDMQFINQELDIIGKSPIPMNRAVDTLLIARKKFPGAQASLDALCKRFNISLHTRDKHGALIDAELLSLVYIEMMSGNQGRICFESNHAMYSKFQASHYQKRNFTASDQELHNHNSLMAGIKNPIWQSK